MPKALDGVHRSVMGSDSIDAEIAHLRDLGLEALRGRWRAAFRREVPPDLPRYLLFAMVAYRLQAEALGGIDAATERFLKRMAQASSDAATVPLTHAFAQQKCRLAPGTVLTREWYAQHHRVMVLEEGFAWNGRTYKSLSEIARTITGTKWNGPRFFGLRNKKQPEAAK